MKNDDLSLLSQLGKRIAYLRKQQGKSQLIFALDCGMSKSYLSDLENGKRNPTVTVLSRVASALGITLESLFRGLEDLSQVN